MRRSWNNSRVILITIWTIACLLAGISVFAGDAKPGPPAPKAKSAYFNCFVPQCEPIQVFMDLKERAILDLEVMLSVHERDTGKELSIVKEISIPPDGPWKFTPETEQVLDRIRWWFREPGEEWRKDPTMECRCTYFGDKIVVYVDGKQVEEYPNPNFPTD